MYIAIDVILTVIIAAVVIGSAKRGFIRSVFQLGSTLAAIVIAVIFYKELSNYFLSAFVLEKTTEYIGGFLGDITADITSEADFSAILGAIPEQVRNTAELVGINLEETLGKLLASNASVTANTFGESLAHSVAAVISNILAFASLFFGSLILLNLLCIVLDKLAKIPVLKGANRFLGFLLGVLEGLVLGIVLAKVAQALCSAYGALNPEFTYTNVVSGTYIAKFFIDICPW